MPTAPRARRLSCARCRSQPRLRTFSLRTRRLPFWSARCCSSPNSRRRDFFNVLASTHGGRDVRLMRLLIIGSACQGPLLRRRRSCRLIPRPPALLSGPTTDRRSKTTQPRPSAYRPYRPLSSCQQQERFLRGLRLHLPAKAPTSSFPLRPGSCGQMPLRRCGRDIGEYTPSDRRGINQSLGRLS